MKSKLASRAQSYEAKQFAIRDATKVEKFCRKDRKSCKIRPIENLSSFGSTRVRIGTVHFRYYFFFNNKKRFFFHFFSKLNKLFLHQTYLKSPLTVKLT